MAKPIIHITGRHMKTDKVVDFYYKSIKQAAFFNPSFTDFREVRFKRLFQQKTKDDVSVRKQQTLKRWE